jgi:hypothetical protein
MLIEISCDIFREKVLRLHPGLNTVIGDPGAANSLGKSTTLMVIDFVFGGDSFLKFNADVVRELGDHAYRFCFKFDGEFHHFVRDTFAPEIVSQCDSQYNPQRNLKLSEYTSWLKQRYFSEMKGLSFRAGVGTYARVWPKDNVSNVKRPLHSFAKQSTADAIDVLIKIFGRFGEISEASALVDAKDGEKKVFSGAAKNSLIDVVGKQGYKENVVQLSHIDQEVVDIKADLAKFALNIRALVDKDLLELKQSKDMLLQEKSIAANKLSRVRRNLQECRYVRSEEMESLQDFIPNIDLARIAKIEEFHSSVARILKAELTESAKSLEFQLINIQIALADIDSKISEKLADFENPTALVDRVYGLSERWSHMKKQNDHFETKERIEREFKDAKAALGTVKLLILNDLQKLINKKIGEIVARVYGQDAKVPFLQLDESAYSYEIVDDTGTGTAFANLVLFDLAILSLTRLPVLLHDLPLFKNVANTAVAKFVEEYDLHIDKQIFVVLDEIDKYSDAAKIIRQRMVLELRDDKVLYIKDWRKK